MLEGTRRVESCIESECTEPSQVIYTTCMQQPTSHDDELSQKTGGGRWKVPLLL